MSYNFEADEKAGKLMDQQDKILERKNAVVLLASFGVEKLTFRNGSEVLTNSYIRTLERHIDKLEEKIKVELDKLPRMKQTIKKYKIVTD